MFEDEAISPAQMDQFGVTEQQSRSDNLSSLGIVLVSVVLAATGQLIFKMVLNDIGELNFTVDMMIKLATSPGMILGLIVYGASAFLWLIALMKADLSFAYPFLSLSYIIILVSAAVFFGEEINALRLVGVALIISGILVIARSEKVS